MIALHRITTEILHLLRVVAEDISEDRLAYRNELRRMTISSLSLPFSEYEHFLERYGYWTLEHRTDAFSLSQAGELAARGDEQRLKSLDDDARYHFQKDLEQLAPTPAPSMSGQRFDQHYIRFDGVGRGGVGSVWRGEQLKTGRPVAIKTLEGLDELMTTGRKSTLKKKIERVMRAVARLDHPFVTPILDLSVHHTPPYYVMPLCGGGSLRDLLRAGPISPELGLNIFAQVCLALEHAHSQGVLHLDLKPENILLDVRGNAQVFDFGLSRVVGKQVALSGRQSYVGFGSVAYMAPELLRDPLVETAAVDIYSLGLVLYEILVGELPGRRSPMPSEVIKDLPLPIDELFDAMVQDSPQRRPQSMQEVLALLNQVAPFDRLSQNSMSIIFHVPPVVLPGLTAVALPEPEVSADPEPPAAVERTAEPSAERASPLSRLGQRAPESPARAARAQGLAHNAGSPSSAHVSAPSSSEPISPASLAREPAPAESLASRVAPQDPAARAALISEEPAAAPSSAEIFAQTPTPTREAPASDSVTLEPPGQRVDVDDVEGRDEHEPSGHEPSGHEPSHLNSLTPLTPLDDLDDLDDIDDIEIEEIDLITNNPSRADLLSQLGLGEHRGAARSADGSSSEGELMSSAPRFEDIERTRPFPTVRRDAPLPSALGARALAQGDDLERGVSLDRIETAAADAALLGEDEEDFDDNEKTALHDSPTPERAPERPQSSSRAAGGAPATALPPLRTSSLLSPTPVASTPMHERLKQRYGSR